MQDWISQNNFASKANYRCVENSSSCKTYQWCMFMEDFSRWRQWPLYRVILEISDNDVCLSRISQSDVSELYIGSYWKSVIMLLFDNIVCKDEREMLYYISSINTHYIQSLVTIHYTHVISLSNISIKTNFKQITRVKLKFVQYSEEDYISCTTSRYIWRSFNDPMLLCFSLTFQWYDIMTK